MSIRKPRHSNEEFVRRGTEIYEKTVRANVEAGNKGKIVAIDIETGEHELAESRLTAAERLIARVPDAQIWFVRVGHRTASRFGAQSRATKQ